MVEQKQKRDRFKKSETEALGESNKPLGSANQRHGTLVRNTTSEDRKTGLPGIINRHQSSPMGAGAQESLRKPRTRVNQSPITVADRVASMKKSQSPKGTAAMSVIQDSALDSDVDDGSLTAGEPTSPVLSNINAQETLTDMQSRFMYSSAIQAERPSMFKTRSMVDDIDLAAFQVSKRKAEIQRSEQARLLQIDPYYITHPAPPNTNQSPTQQASLRVSGRSSHQQPQRTVDASLEQMPDAVETQKSSLLMDPLRDSSGSQIGRGNEAGKSAMKGGKDVKFDSIMDRKAFADIAHQTFNNQSEFGQVDASRPAQGQHQAKRATMNDMKITVGSIGISESTANQRAVDHAAETQPIVSRGLMHMVKTDITRDKQEKTVSGHNFKNHSQSVFRHAQSNNSTLDDELRDTKTLTKAEISIDDSTLRAHAKSALGVDTKKIGSNSTFINVQVGNLNQNSSKLVGQSDKLLQLPALKGQSQDVLIGAQTDNSLAKDPTSIANMQSQSPMRTLGLDFNTDAARSSRLSGNRHKRQLTDFSATQGGVTSKIPPLQNILLAESLASSMHDQSDAKMPQTGEYKGKTSTPGREWEATKKRQNQTKVVQDFTENPLQSSILEPQFALFKKQEKGLDIERRNRQKVQKTPQLEAADPSVFASATKTPLIKAIGDKLFDQVGTQPTSSTFGGRSRSVLHANTLAAYTPLKADNAVAVHASTLQRKRHSSVIGTVDKDYVKAGIKEGTRRHLGFIGTTRETFEITAEDMKEDSVPKYQPKINFPNVNLTMDQKTGIVKLKTVPGLVGPNRFETGDKMLKMPGTVIEQWIDATLEEDDIDIAEMLVQQPDGTSKKTKPLAAGQASASHGKDDVEYSGVSRIQKTKQTQGASLRYGIDYQSLSRNGLNQEQVLRLQRSIYVHTIGFYEVIKDCCKAAKNKKSILVGALRVYQQVLEKCHKNEWKMLINEVAKQYEVEIDVAKDELRAMIIQKEQIIAKQRRELKEATQKHLDLQSKVYSEQEAFQRLNETYLILQHHNEEGLSLRMQTEGRLKELFRRERQTKEVIARTEHDRQQHRQEQRDNNKRIKELEGLVNSLTSMVKEKEGIAQVFKGEMLAQKRKAFAAESQLKKIEGPYKSVQEQLIYMRARAEKMEQEARTQTVKADLQVSQNEPLDNMIKLLESQVVNLKLSNESLEKNEAQMRVKMNEALTELHEKSGMFNGAQDEVTQARTELQKAQQKLRTNTTLMYAYDKEKADLSEKLFFAESKLREITGFNQQQSAAIAMVSKHEHERGVSWREEIARNGELLKKIEELERELMMAQTTTLHGLQQTIDEQAVTIESLREENNSRKVGADLAKKLANQEQNRKKNEISLHIDQQRHLKAELRAAQMSETRYRADFLKKINQLHDREAKISEYKKREAAYKSEIFDVRKRMEQYIGVSQTFEAEKSFLTTKVARLEAEKVNFAAQIAEGNKLVTKQLDNHEEYQLEAINKNIMIGEDYRSRALNYYHEIKELKQTIQYIKAEPSLWKERHLKLITQWRREGEAHLMEQEDIRQEIKALHRVIAGKDEAIAALDKRHEHDLYLVKIIQQKLGYAFTIAHAEVQAGVVQESQSTQTNLLRSHRGIQAQGFNQADSTCQTEKLMVKSGSDFQSDEGSNFRMPAKKVIKKRKSPLPQHHMSPGVKGGNTSQSSFKRKLSSSPVKRRSSLSSRRSSVGSSSRSPQRGQNKSPGLATIMQKPRRLAVAKSGKKTPRLLDAGSSSPTVTKGARPRQMRTQVVKAFTDKTKRGSQNFLLQPTAGDGPTIREVDNSSEHEFITQAGSSLGDAAFGGTLKDVNGTGNNFGGTKTVGRLTLREVAEDENELDGLVNPVNEQGKMLHKGKFKLGNRQLQKPQIVTKLGPPPNPNGSVRQGIYSTIGGGSAKVARKASETERKERMKRDQSIKGLIRNAAARDDSI